jgi:hypothetical protein
MTRATTGAFDTATQAPSIKGIFFAEFQFASGSVRLTSNQTDVSWNGFTWTGGAAVSISELREVQGNESVGLTFDLAGVNSAYISLALTEFVKGRTATLWFAPLDANYQVIANPSVEFIGLIDSMPIIDGQQNATVRLQCESRAIEWKRVAQILYTNETQQLLFPGDNFFDFLPQLVEKQIVWPAKSFFRQ